MWRRFTTAMPTLAPANPWVDARGAAINTSTFLAGCPPRVACCGGFSGQGFHWKYNAEALFLMGKVLGDEMVDLLAP